MGVPTADETHLRCSTEGVGAQKRGLWVGALMCVMMKSLVKEAAHVRAVCYVGHLDVLRATCRGRVTDA